ncbi:MAG: CRISPR-associated endonuclease Cas6 [Candidatus Cloacimonadaceae bacterium]|nr:CRISPR-associated endonuclease Cas6 [Candidatus Cloacimonadaceae bacterium]MDP3115109.1 CRISPR-associated endonuclease Cas6 [Candidatus Cloacimonadaceae bacterium]
MIAIRYLVITFTDVQMRPSDIPKLRGYFSNKYPHDHLFHNHLPGQGFIYKSPSIQYRIIDGHPALLAINEGIDLMKKMFLEIDQIRINDKIISTYEREVILREEDFGKSPDFHKYRFSTPWMALNSENYAEYKDANPVDQSAMLKRILKNNLKTLSKGFGYWIEDFDSVRIDGWFKPMDVSFHGIAMNCFKGEFTTNFIIPEYLGLGKQSARGFGVIRRLYD